MAGDFTFLMFHGRDYLSINGQQIADSQTVLMYIARHLTAYSMII